MGGGLRDLLPNFGTPFVSHEQLKLEGPAHAVCAEHSMQPSPNYFGLLLFINTDIIQ